MPQPYRWASDLLSRPPKSQQRRGTAKRRRLRLFETLESRVVMTAVAWYPLDETAGVVASDVSGNANHGTVTGGVWADGQLGGAIEFNADGNIAVPAATFDTIDQQVTFAFWVYGGDTQPTNDSILYGVNSSGGRAFNVHMSFSNSRVYWDAGNDSGYDRINNAITDPLIHKNSWHHWAFTKNATTGEMNIYLDGVSWASGTGKTKAMSGITSFVLGSHTNGSEGYDGRLDDVRIYDTALTAAEVLDLYTTTTSPNTEEVLVTNHTLAATDNATTVITSANLQATDAEQSASELTYTVTSLPEGGTLFRGGTALGAYGTFTQADIDNHVVTYDHNGASIADTFSFVVNDGLGSVTSGTFGILLPNDGTANSLAELRALAKLVNNATVTLSTTGGDPHPVTGVVTPGTYWINGDHLDTSAGAIEPKFMEFLGDGNTFDLTGTTIRADTREFAGFGRGLGHGSGVHLVILGGSNNLLTGLTLIGEDIALDTDPTAQRYADWGTQYVKLTGDDNTIDGATVVARGSHTEYYGLSDAFGKGSSQGQQPYLGHRKAAGLNVDDATNAVVNHLNLTMKTFGHGFFTGTEVTNTTLKNSTITGELFPSQNVIDRPEYQEYGHTWWGYPIQDNIQLSGSEGGVRTYGGTDFTIENVVVDGMRTGFATVATAGDVSITNSFAYNTTSGFDVGNNTTITASGGNIVNGPLLTWYSSGGSPGNSTIELELKGGTPVGVNWSAVYVNGNNVDITLTSELAAGDLPEESYIRLGQKYFENWRDSDFSTAAPDGNNPIPLSNSTFVNNTNQKLVIGVNAEGNVGSSQSPVISNGKANYYDGVTLVQAGSRLELVHAKGLGNNGTEKGAEFDSSGNVVYTGTATAATYDDNGTIVENGATLQLLPGVWLSKERVTISGDGVDGLGAVYSEGGSSEHTRLNGDTVVLDGNASIGVVGEGYIVLSDSITGTGDFTKRGSGALSFGKPGSLVGNFFVEEGTLEGRSNVVRGDLFIQSDASIAAFAGNMVNAPNNHAEIQGTWNLNARGDDSVLAHQIGSIAGSGTIISSDPTNNPAGTVQLRSDSGSADYTGSITGLVNIEKTGTSTQVFSGNLTHTGTTTVAGGTLRIDGTHTGGGVYTVDSSATLGGTGSIGSAVTVNSGGH
ncbi:LamG-like jellyroll fold domain-containing protein, partial [Rubripirellula tenax]|uniref:LamG-like jellyroll fold domain-containing protein n=1 Tax=Rubripirellula tenax TaxID=2528015 RepID=UPI0011B4E05E